MRSPLSKAIHRNLVNLFLIAACILTVVRFFSPLVLNTDPSTQIGAALSLLNGEGLVSYVPNKDISQAPLLQPLISFPPTFSLLIASGLQFGIPLDLTLKILYAAAMLIGWMGWGILFKEIFFLIDRSNRLSNTLATGLAIGLPLFFSLDWCNTDPFLWSGVPFVIYGSYVLNRDKEHTVTKDLALGGLVGLLYTLRPLGIFLLLYLALLTLFRRQKFSSFLYSTVGFLVVGFVPVSVYRFMATRQNVVPEVIPGPFDLQPWATQVPKLLPALRQVGFALFSHLNQSDLIRDLGVLILLVFLSFLYTYQKNWRSMNLSQFSLGLLLEHILLANLAIVFYILGASFFKATRISADMRLIYPLFPSLIFWAYGMAFYRLKSGPEFSKLQRFLFTGTQGVAIFSLLVFVAFSLRSAFYYPDKIFGFYYFNVGQHLVEYPSSQILTRDPASYQKLLDLLRQNSNTIALSFAEDFDFNHTVDPDLRRRIVRIKPALEEENYISSQSVQAYLVFAIKPRNCSGYCYHDSGKSVEFLQTLEAKPVYRNNEENIQIVSVQIPQNFQF
jgi:hypothetical protein